MDDYLFFFRLRLLLLSLWSCEHSVLFSHCGEDVEARHRAVMAVIFFFSVA